MKSAGLAIGSGLWETMGMEKRKPKYPGDDPKGVTVPRLRRTPKKGDRVGAQGQNGAFIVVAVNGAVRTARIEIDGETQTSR